MLARVKEKLCATDAEVAIHALWAELVDWR